MTGWQIAQQKPRERKVFRKSIKNGLFWLKEEAVPGDDEKARRLNQRDLR